MRETTGLADKDLNNRYYTDVQEYKGIGTQEKMGDKKLEFLEMENSVSEVENILDRIKSRQIAVQQTSKSEDPAIKTEHIEKGSKQQTRQLTCGTLSRGLKYVSTGVPRRKKLRGEWMEIISGERTTDFSKLD